MLKKLILGLVLVFVAIFAFLYFFGTGYLNRGVKAGVEKYGPEITKTSVRLDSANLSVFSGSGSLKGLYVGNPEGFSEENLFGLGQIDIDLQPRTVLSDRIIIDKIHIREPAIRYEQKMSGSNIQKLLRNIEEFTGPAEEPPEEPEAGEGPGKQVVIRELIIEEGSIYSSMLGTGATVNLPRIELNDIGEEGNRKTIGQVVQLVIDEILGKVGSALTNSGKLLEDGGKKLLEEGGGRVREGADKIKEEAGKAGDKIRGLLNQE